ncbi:MAG TPA: penicillin-binding transpeptidase domain-containing protein [Actinomycetota bacterium]
MDRRIRRLGIGLVVLFGLLFAQLSYVQVIHADYIKARPANARRQIIAEYRVERGPIISADGVVLARSVRNADRRSELRFRRLYPEGPLFAGITGYYSRIYGRAELEQAANPYLSGDAPELAVSTFTDLILGRQRKGGAVITTIRADLQRAAADALGDLPGAVVAVEPETGDVLALYANPTYDPNAISSGTDESINEAWEAIRTDPDQPLISRAKDELFLPGSTGKLVTASAALENGIDPNDVRWPNPRFLDLPQTSNTLANFGDSHCNGGSQMVSMAEAFQESCNVTFAEIGLDLGAREMSEQARAYGFCATDPPEQVECEAPTIPFVLPWANGRFPVPSYFADRQPQLAFSAIGLDNVLTNPLHLALISAAIANDGEMMQPRLITEVRDPTGRVVREFDPEQYGQPISDDSAREMREMMLSVTQGGTATSAFSGFPIDVAGKTGTATNGEDRPPNAWFTAFAPAGQGDVAEIAVAVIVLDGGNLGNEATGGQVSAPIARAVIDAYLSA